MGICKKYFYTSFYFDSHLKSKSLPKTAIPDVEASKPRKTVEKKKHLQVLKMLKESVRATIITKHILNLGVNLTVDKLLVSAPAIEK